MEWENHFSSVPKADLERHLFTATTLLRVFCEARTRRVKTWRYLVEEIIGQSNEVENVQEFLKVELAIQVEDVPSLVDQGEYNAVRDIWFLHKRRSRVMSDDLFELLVSNDAKAYCAIVQRRKTFPLRGNSYGQKIWLLTFDSMTWRIPSLIGRRGDHLYQVAMSMDYIINYVATASQAGILSVPEGVILASASLDETESGGADLREIVAEKWTEPGEKAYQRTRRLRDLVQNLKAGWADSLDAEDSVM